MGHTKQDIDHGTLYAPLVLCTPLLQLLKVEIFLEVSYLFIEKCRSNLMLEVLTLLSSCHMNINITTYLLFSGRSRFDIASERELFYHIKKVV